MSAADIDLGDSGAASAMVLHGFRPDAAPAEAFTPPLTIALARQTGARGRAVAERVAEILGFTFYSPEAIDLAADDPGAQLALEELPPQAVGWCEERFNRLSRKPVARHPEMSALVRTILEIGAGGRAVLLGKGAAAILPKRTTLHVRLLAPENDRIAYVAQWERMSPAEAEVHVRQREKDRRKYMTGKFGVDPDVASQYDLSLNTSTLGVELCAEVIAACARVRDPRTDPASA
jgi:cytidylate kinase